MYRLNTQWVEIAKMTQMNVNELFPSMSSTDHPYRRPTDLGSRFPLIPRTYAIYGASACECTCWLASTNSICAQTQSFTCYIKLFNHYKTMIKINFLFLKSTFAIATDFHKAQFTLKKSQISVNLNNNLQIRCHQSMLVHSINQDIGVNFCYSSI